MNFASLKSALGQAVQSAASTAKDLSAQVVGARNLRDYTLQEQVATGGSHGVWKIYNARSRKEGAQNRVVSVWILDKRPPQTSASGRWEVVIDLCRKDAAALARLKHPAIVKVVEPMEETRTQLVMVTEAIFASSLDMLNRFEGLPVQRQRQDVRLSELEVKAGLLQIADALQFLHQEANLVHRGISPGAVLLCSSGSWKLAGLAFATRTQYGASADEATVQPFSYENPAPPLWQQLSQAPLAYVAPELARASSAAPGAAFVTPAADIFSLGALVYELVAGKQLFPVGNSLSEYQAKLSSINFMEFGNFPPQLLPTLKAMLSVQPAARPNANAFSGASYFQEDVVVRALRFLEGFLQRDALQKAAFLKDLETLWPRCDARLLRYWVLPPLLAEARTEALQPIILPLIMRIIQHQDAQDFADYTLPALAPLCLTANGTALFQLTRFADIMFAVMMPATVVDVLIPLLARAADHGDVRTQEEMLKRTAALADKADYAALKQVLLPRVQQLCLATTSAAVRSASLAALTALAPRFDKEIATGMVATLQQVLKVDRSSPTVAGAVKLGQALVSTWGHIFSAEFVLPLLTPCLAAPNLSREQFKEVYRALEEMLASIANSRVSNLDEEAPTANSTGQVSSSGAVPSWDTGPSTPPSPHPGAGMEESLTKPTHQQQNAGVGGARPPATPAWPSAPTAAWPSAKSSHQMQSSPLHPSSTALKGAQDPFASSSAVSRPAAAPMRMGNPSAVQSAETDSDPFAGWPPAQSAQVPSSSAPMRSTHAPILKQSMHDAALPRSTYSTATSESTSGPNTRDPFADWPPAGGAASKAAMPQQQQAASWQPSFSGRGAMDLASLGMPALANNQPSSRPMTTFPGSQASRTAPPKLAPPPRAGAKSPPPAIQAPFGAGQDSLI